MKSLIIIGLATISSFAIACEPHPKHPGVIPIEEIMADDTLKKANTKGRLVPPHSSEQLHAALTEPPK